MPESPFRPSLFTVRFNQLVETLRTSDGGRWTDRAVADALTSRGHQVSRGHIHNLRRGLADARISLMVALAALFGVPVAYFVESDAAAARIARALTDPAIQAVACRMQESGLSPRGKAFIALMVEQVLDLEQHHRAAETLGAPPGGSASPSD